MVEEYRRALYRLIEEHKKVNVWGIAKELGYRKRDLRELTKKETGVTSKRLLEKVIVEYIKDGIQLGKTEEEIAAELRLSHDTINRILKRNSGECFRVTMGKYKTTRNMGFIDSYLGRRLLNLIVFLMSYLPLVFTVVFILVLTPSDLTKKIGLTIMYVVVILSVVSGQFAILFDISYCKADDEENTRQERVCAEYIRKLSTMVELEMLIYVCFFIKTSLFI